MMQLVTKADHDDLVRIASLSGLESDLLRSPGITRWLDRRARTLGLDEKSHRAMLMQSEATNRGRLQALQGNYQSVCQLGSALAP